MWIRRIPCLCGPPRAISPTARGKNGQSEKVRRTDRFCLGNILVAARALSPEKPARENGDRGGGRRDEKGTGTGKGRHPRGVSLHWPGRGLGRRGRHPRGVSLHWPGRGLGRRGRHPRGVSLHWPGRGLGRGETGWGGGWALC